MEIDAAQESDAAAASKGELVLYATDDGAARLYLRAEGGTVWLAQPELAQLFQATKQNVSLHINNILTEGELPEATVKDYLTVQTEGHRRVRRRVQSCSLDMILAIGYRVKSPCGTQFRQWAITELKPQPLRQPQILTAAPASAGTAVPAMRTIRLVPSSSPRG